MRKVLLVPREERCIGCMLCVIRASLIKSGKIDFSKSYIRVVLDQGSKKYKVIIDYGEARMVEEIANSCPRKCFEIEERHENN